MKGTKKQIKLDVLAFGAHPDDVEACASGLLIKLKEEGLKTGIVDLTRGEASNFGGPAERDLEAQKAAKILKLDVRENLDIADEHVLDNEDNLSRVVEVLRKYRPEIVLLPYYQDLHPDHAITGVLGKKACFFSKIKKYSEKIKAPSHEPTLILYYMLHTEFKPSLVLDISKEYPLKLKSICAHKSQFFKKVSGRYTKDFHNPEFMDFFESRSKVHGYRIGAKYGEPYLLEGTLGLTNLSSLVSGGNRSLTPQRKKK